MAKATKQRTPSSKLEWKETQREFGEWWKKHVAKADWRAVRSGGVPRTIPPGRVLVHNQAMRTIDMPVGVNGFHAWTQKPDPKGLALCQCGWSGLPHYHARGLDTGRSEPGSWRDLTQRVEAGE